MRSIILIVVMEIVSIITTGSYAIAQDELKTTSNTKQMSFNGVGTHSCGKYIELMKPPRRETYQHLYQQWGAGFMAGASNEGQGANPHADLETYTAWLDKWCADDPASSVVAGIRALGKRLSAQQ